MPITVHKHLVKIPVYYWSDNNMMDKNPSTLDNFVLNYYYDNFNSVLITSDLQKQLINEFKSAFPELGIRRIYSRKNSSSTEIIPVKKAGLIVTPDDLTYQYLLKTGSGASSNITLSDNFLDNKFYKCVIIPPNYIEQSEPRNAISQNIFIGLNKGSSISFNDKSIDFKQFISQYPRYFDINVEYYVEKDSINRILFSKKYMGAGGGSFNETTAKYKSFISAIDIALVDGSIIVDIQKYFGGHFSTRSILPGMAFPLILQIKVTSMHYENPSNNLYDIKYTFEGNSIEDLNKKEKICSYYENINGVQEYNRTSGETIIEINYKFITTDGPVLVDRTGVIKMTFPYSYIGLNYSGGDGSNLYSNGSQFDSTNISSKIYDRNNNLQSDNTSDKYYDAGTRDFQIGASYIGAESPGSFGSYDATKTIGIPKENSTKRLVHKTTENNMLYTFETEHDANITILDSDYNIYLDNYPDNDDGTHGNIYVTLLNINRYISLTEITAEPFGISITTTKPEIDEDIDIYIEVKEDLEKDLFPIEVIASQDAELDFEINIEVNADIESDLLNPITVLAAKEVPVDSFEIEVTAYNIYRPIEDIEDYINKTYLGSQQAAEDFQLLMKVTDTSYWPVEYTIDADYHIHIKPDPMYLGVELYACTNKQFLYCKYDMMNL